MLRNVLTRPVPRLAAEHAEQVLQTVLRDAGLRAGRHRRLDHARGRARRADRAARPAELTADDLRYSADMLRQYGNMSSAFVYFVLQAALTGQRQARMVVDVRRSAPDSVAMARCSKAA